MHPERNEVESKPLPVLDMTRIDLPRHERIKLVIRLLGGLRATAKIVERSTATVNNWRKEGATITVDDLAKLSHAAGVTMDWLAGIDHTVRMAG